MHKATLHGTKAITAVKKGNMKLAAHHFGHALAATKYSGSGSTVPDDSADPEMDPMESEAPAAPVNSLAGLRNRLSTMKSSKC